MKIVVDQNIRGAEHSFGAHGELVFREGRQITARDLDGAEVLIVRTATRIDRDLLGDSGVRFVGSTAIGTDHMDTDWLDRNGIAWSNAPGCNADSAAQYTLAMIWLACKRMGRPLTEQSVGIVGRGNVGSRLQNLLTSIGVATVANDPPLADRGEHGLAPLEQVLDCPIVSLHVPLEKKGRYPTRRMIGADQLASLPDDALLVNTARGDVIDGEALLRELRAGRLHAALDVWPGEPFFSSELLSRTLVSTPHVAGYSEDGRRNGTRIVYNAFCAWAGLEPRSHPGSKTSVHGLTEPELVIEPSREAMTAALGAACFVAVHDQAMAGLVALSNTARANAFDRLRREYPSRRDFHAWTLRMRGACPDPDPSLLGFRVRQMGD